MQDYQKQHQSLLIQQQQQQQQQQHQQHQQHQSKAPPTDSPHKPTVKHEISQPKPINFNQSPRDGFKHANHHPTPGKPSNPGTLSPFHPQVSYNGSKLLCFCLLFVFSCIWLNKQSKIII